MTEWSIENLEGWNIVDGVITNPGKFEQEPYYVLYFYDLLGNGFIDHNKWEKIEQREKEMFPELKEYSMIRIFEDNLGFVYIEEIE